MEESGTLHTVPVTDLVGCLNIVAMTLRLKNALQPLILFCKT